jgi:hypothetical protein
VILQVTVFGQIYTSLSDGNGVVGIPDSDGSSQKPGWHVLEFAEDETSLQLPYGLYLTVMEVPNNAVGTCFEFAKDGNIIYNCHMVYT